MNGVGLRMGSGANLNTYGDISPNTAGGLEATMLRVAAPRAVTARFAQVDEMPMNKGNTKTYRRYHSLPPATAPLADGVTPAGQRITYDDLEVVLEEYGDYVPLTNRVKDLHTDPVLQTMSKRCGDQIVDTTELVNIEVLKGGTNVVYAAGVAGRSSIVSAVTRSDFRLAERALHNQRADVISEIIKATPKIATEPVAEAFFAMTHTDMKADIENVQGFTPVEKYADSDGKIKYEIGKVGSVRILATNNFTPWAAAGGNSATLLANGADPASATACDVYPIIIVGKDAYGTVPLRGKRNVKPRVLQPDTPRGGDPIGQRGSVGWNKYHACLILNQLWMIRIETGCTAVPD